MLPTTLDEIALGQKNDTISLRKPNKWDYLMVRRGAEWIIGPYGTITKDRTISVISKSVVDAVDPRYVDSVVFRLGVTSQKETLVIPVRIGNDNWARSFSEAMTYAEGTWTNVVAHSVEGAGGYYEVRAAKGDLGEPIWPVGLTMKELLTRAVGPNFIGRADHPVLKRIRGE